MDVRRSGIAVAGSILVDSINTVSAYPDQGELVQISSVTKATGGCVPNVAIDLKRLDPSLSVSAVGCVGRDEDGTLVQETLSAYGIDISQLRKTEEKTSFTQVMSVAGGQRTFFTYAGASALFGLEDVDFSALHVKRLHLGYFLLLNRVDSGDGAKILQRAQSCGIKTSIDLVSENSDRYQRVISCLPFTDDLIVNELEAARITGMEPMPDQLPKIAKQLLALGVRERVIIHFPEGALCASRNGNLTGVGSYLLPDGYIRGTTGAGDAFCAGALYALYREWNDQQILECGTGCAAMSLGSCDAVSAVPDMNTVLTQCKGLERRKPGV